MLMGLDVSQFAAFAAAFTAAFQPEHARTIIRRKRDGGPAVPTVSRGASL